MENEENPIARGRLLPAEHEISTINSIFRLFEQMVKMQQV
jgi:hypothetical protein